VSASQSRPPLRTTITDALVDQLREQIRAGHLLPGSRLRQATVAAEFNVSTTPVREAFAALEREGRLVSSPHRGVIVFQPTVADLQETYEIRIPLEALATELGVKNMTEADIEELRGLLAQMRVLARRDAETDRMRYGELNLKFHSAIYRAARRPMLAKLIADLRESSAAYLRLNTVVSPTADETQADHTRIYEACQAHAPKRAAKAMISHLEHTVERVARALSQQTAETHT
jgi:DNA-binding GntR family transcriptional regulator